MEDRESLTPRDEQMNNIPEPDLLRRLGLKGYICCASCGRKVVMPIGSRKEQVSCPFCHHPTMAIRLADDRFYLSADNQPYTYATALDALLEMNRQMKAKEFDRAKWQKKAIEERLFENCALRWLADRKTDMKNDIISESYFGNLRTYVKIHFVGLQGKDVTRMKIGIIQDFYNGLKGSPKQRKNVIDELKRVFGWLLIREEITLNQMPIWKNLKMAPVIEEEAESCTYDEQMKDLSRIPKEDRDIFEFIMETGLRPSEGCAFMKVDLKLATREAIIRHNYCEGKLTEKPKQKKQYTIPLSDRAWELVMKNIDNPTPFAFMNPRTGRGYRYKVLNRLWNEHSVSGVELYGGTRHSLPEQMFALGADPKMVQKQMRHASLKTTMKYSHPTTERTRQILNRRGGNVIDLKHAGKTHVDGGGDDKGK